MFLFCAEWLYCNREQRIHSCLRVNRNVWYDSNGVLRLCFGKSIYMYRYVVVRCYVCVCVCIYIYLLCANAVTFVKNFHFWSWTERSTTLLSTLYFTLVNIRAVRQFSLVCLFFFFVCFLRFVAAPHMHNIFLLSFKVGADAPIIHSNRIISLITWLFRTNFPDSNVQWMFKCTSMIISVRQRIICYLWISTLLW